MKIRMGRFLCWCGRHQIATIVDWHGGVRYTARGCRRCEYIDESTIKTQLANRAARRIRARA